MGNSNDPCADSTPVGVSLLPVDNLPAGAGTDLPVVAISLEAFYEL
jgi:hypothetical protein